MVSALEEIANYLQSLNTQKVEGFSTIEDSSHSGQYDSWDGKVQSWWEYSNDIEQKVVWRSAICPKKQHTALVFSGALGVAAGESRLFVNDQPVLNFNTGIGPETEEWRNGDYRLKFFSILTKPNKERHGIFCLTMPEKEVSTGKHVTLKAEGFKKTSAGKSFFMLHGIADTLIKLAPSTPSLP